MATDNKATTEQAPKKRERSSINGTRALLEVRGKEPGFHYAWINDEYVHDRQDQGFEHVRHPVQVGARRLDVSKMPSDSFVCRNVGNGVIAYLMRIPLDFYKEDMAAMQQEVDERTKAQIGNLSKDGLSGNVTVKSGLTNLTPDFEG